MDPRPTGYTLSQRAAPFFPPNTSGCHAVNPGSTLEEEDPITGWMNILFTLLKTEINLESRK
jgi:hypothetical protein